MPFTVTRDVLSPTVAITVPARSDVVTVTVGWSGDDPSAGSGQAPGSGVGSYDLEVSEDGADWTRLPTKLSSPTSRHRMLNINRSLTAPAPLPRQKLAANE